MIRNGKRKFLYRIIISVLAILLFCFIVIFVLSNAFLHEKEIGNIETESVRITGMLMNSINEDIQLAKHFVASLYNIDYYTDIPNQLYGSESFSPRERLALFNKVEDYLESCLSTEDSVQSVSIISPDNTVFLESRKNSAVSSKYSDFLLEQYEASEKLIGAYGPTLLPCYKSGGLPSGQIVIPVFSRIKTTDMKNNAGVLIVEVSANSIERNYSEMFQYLVPDILILSEDGIPYYTYGNLSQGINQIDFETIKQSNNEFIKTDDGYVRAEFDADSSLYFVCIYPSAQIDYNISSQIITIALILSGIAIVAVVLSTVILHLYYKRIDNICDTIDSIAGGALEKRIVDDGSDDEISRLSDNINLLTDKLNINIQEAYVAGKASRENEMLRKDAELKLVNTELYALQTQINPHFLHNTLEAIRMRSIACGNSDVARMTYILSVLFKYSLKKDYIVSAREELDMALLYIELTKIRYPDKINLSVIGDSDIGEYGMLRHILQPILENSLSHGFAAQNEIYDISIEFIASEKELQAIIKDSGTGIPESQLEALKASLSDTSLPESRKIGLRNVHSRLVRIFGSEYGLELDSEENVGTTVSIHMPAMSEEDMKNYVQSFNC